MTAPHGERKHAKYSPSGMERIVACPGSVKLSEGMPEKTSAAAMEGTRCHEVLERLLKKRPITDPEKVSNEMFGHAKTAADFIRNTWYVSTRAHLMVESRVSLSFIHPEFWGSLDAAVVEHFGTLTVFDLKYGVHHVSPVRNLQLVCYALGVANQFDWCFKKVKLTIIQPRARGYDGPTFWELDIPSLKKYIAVFQEAIEKAEKQPDVFVEGDWCWFCKAKTKCPLKQEERLGKVRQAFSKPL